MYTPALRVKIVEDNCMPQYTATWKKIPTIWYVSSSALGGSRHAKKEEILIYTRGLAVTVALPIFTLQNFVSETHKNLK